jgi:excisionase family DNA binding protein
MVRRMTKRKMNDEETFLTRNEAAGALRVSLSTVDRMLTAGDLEKTKVGKRLVRIPQSSVDHLLLGDGPSGPAAS